MANKNGNAGAVIGIGVGVAAAAAAAGGAYWLYGSKHSAQHRKLAKSWMLKARAEVMDAIEKLDDIDKEKYMGIVQDVVGRYAANASPAEMASVMKDFKTAWSHMQGPKKAKRSAAKKRPAKAARKSATKRGSRK